MIHKKYRDAVNCVYQIATVFSVKRIMAHNILIYSCIAGTATIPEADHTVCGTVGVDTNY